MSSKKILTIPNVLSLIRLCMIPFIIWFYIFEDRRQVAAILIVASGITDVVDGFIARKFHMESDLGKVLDPIADKLTQIATMGCLLYSFKYMMIPLMLLIVKEISVGILGLLEVKITKKPTSARWHGKLATATLYLMMAFHLFWPTLPYPLSYVLVILSTVCIALTFVLYSKQRLKTINENKNETSQL